MVVVLISLFESSHDGYRLRRSGLIYHHFLESSLKGFVLLEILLIFVQCGRTYGAQFSTRQSRFQDVGRVHRARASACAHEGMDLIYEQYDVALAFNDLLDHSLESFLEFALILRTRYKCTHVKRIDFAVLEVRRDLSVCYLLCYTLGNGCLANAGLAYEYRVVLCSAGKYLQHASYLFIAPDYGVKFALFGLLVEIYGIFA